MRKSIVLGIVAIAALAIWGGAPAADVGDKDKGHDADKGHVAVRPDDIKWGPAPPGLPPGAKVAVLMGDPSKAAPYVLRAQMPDGYKVPPHWHPTAENVTVLKGTLMLGKGEKFSADAAEALPAGSFMSMPKDMRHFAWAKGETIIQVHGIGPFDISYVNAADDPRNKK
jgi:ChrR Cupin-like domain